MDKQGMDKGKVARELLSIARELTAVKSRFTILKPLQLKKEGATTDSIENARRLKAAGYELINGSMKFDMNFAKWETTAYFYRKEDGSDGVHIFQGFSFGYGGQGPRGLEEFLSIFGWNPSSKILERGVWPEKGNLNLKAFT